jgi:hypothetical protein
MFRELFSFSLTNVQKTEQKWATVTWLFFDAYIFSTFCLEIYFVWKESIPSHSIVSSNDCDKFMRYALFWGITQPWLVVLYRGLGKNISVTYSRVKKSWARIGYPETSVWNYHSMLRNIAEERRPHRDGSLKSRVKFNLMWVFQN